MDLFKKIQKAEKKIFSFSLADLTNWYRWFLKRLPDISHLKNIVLFSGAATVVVLVLFSQRFSSLDGFIPKSPLRGGTYSEGVVGRVEQLSPLYSNLSQSESAVTRLIFSGLTKRDGNRRVVSDLAEKWEVSNDGLGYRFFLRKNVLWHDGEKLTADDIVFTVETVQNPDTRSTFQEIWKGVEAKKINDYEVLLKLQAPYAPFIYNTNLSIIPKHLLEKVTPRSLKTAEFNTKPVGTGPFQYSETKNIKDSQEVILKENPNYFLGRPYIQNVFIKTYGSKADLADGYARKEIMGVSRSSADDAFQKTKLSGAKLYQTAVPEYDVLIMNLRSGLTKNKSLRQAIRFAISPENNVSATYHGLAVPIAGPILPGFIGYDPKIQVSFNVSESRKLIEGQGYSVGADGYYAKDGNVLSFKISTSDDPEKVTQAENIEGQLKLAGIKAEIEVSPFGALIQETIRPRKFDLLLVTQNPGPDSDIYAFWHSTQANDPGLNFSGISDRRLDKYLEIARKSLQRPERITKLKEVQRIITEESPAVFIDWPNYTYVVSSKVYGINLNKLLEPNDRFWNIEKWFINSERVNDGNLNNR
jgi:peptide/nickel transport system substrate-binding protein